MAIGANTGRLHQWWRTRARWQQVLIAAGAVLAALIVAGSIVAANKHTSQPAAPEPSSTDTETTTSPLADPQTDEGTVIATIRTTFCTSEIDTTTIPLGGGAVQFTCTGADPGGQPVIFWAFPTPARLQAGLTDGTVTCLRSGDILIDGPAWAADVEYPSDAGTLVNAGGNVGTCP